MATNVQGSSTFRRIQIAHEGFAAAPSSGAVQGTHRGEAITTGGAYHALVNGALTVTPEVEYLIPEETRASLAERHSVTPVQRQAALSFSGPADFEQIVDFLKMSIKGNVQTSDTSTEVDLHTFKPNLGNLNDPSSYSVVYGDNVKNFASAYVMASQISLSGTMGEAVQLSVDMFAQDLTESSAPATGDATSRWQYQAPYKNIQNMVSLRSEFFIAESLAELYTTPARKGGYLRSWELTLPTGCRPYHTAEGKALQGDPKNNKLDYRLHIEDMRTGEVALSFISQNETWDNEFEAWLAGSGRWIRIVVHGPAITPTVKGTTGGSFTASASTTTYTGLTAIGSGWAVGDTFTLTGGVTGTITSVSTPAGGITGFTLSAAVSAGSTTIDGRSPTTGKDRFFEFVAFVRYDDNPEIFADDDGKSLLNFTAHTYDPHRATEVGFPASGTTSVGGTDPANTPALALEDTDNFDFVIRVQSAGQDTAKRT